MLACSSKQGTREPFLTTSSLIVKDCAYTHYVKVPAYNFEPRLAAMMDCQMTVIPGIFCMPLGFNEDTTLSRGGSYFDVSSLESDIGIEKPRPSLLI